MGVRITIDGKQLEAREGDTILGVLQREGIETPTLCQLDTLTPVNTCRLCVVEVEGSRTLVPSCARTVEEGMAIRTGTERVRRSRRVVIELLGSSVDLDRSEDDLRRWVENYRADPTRFGPPAPAAGPGERDGRRPGHHPSPTGESAETVAQPPKIHDEMYVRDYGRCVLCYRCVQACGIEAQNTFAIAVAGRGFDARISTEFDIDLTESACVYCGNCIAVCPTGALIPVTEWELREAGAWDESRQQVTRTVCPYCGVGCNLELRTQDNRIVRVTSPMDHSVTRGNLCVKGRFGWQHL